MRAPTLTPKALMARSMTAFANAESKGAPGQLVFELRSVNHRFLELGLKLPEELRALEPHLREMAQKLIALQVPTR